MVVIRKKSFKFIVSVSVFYLSWCILTSYSVACSRGHETSPSDQKDEEITLIKDHTSKLPSRGLEKVSLCQDQQGDASRLMETLVLSRPQTEKPPFYAFTPFVSKTRPSFHLFSNVTARVSVEPSADPGKLYLQNQSFLC